MHGMSEKTANKASRKETSTRKLAEDSDDSVPEVKKSRGRPKKDVSDKKPPKPLAEPSEKKTRGRPKGSVKTELSKVAPNSKRRGRPRKDKKKSEDEDQASENED